jgi:thiol-disulfide isomerase/thioredoxin
VGLPTVCVEAMIGGCGYASGMTNSMCCRPAQFFIVSTLALLAAGIAWADPPPLPPGTVAPHFVTKTLAGKPFDSKSLIGHITVLDFWATWCVSCKEEMPSIEKLSRDYAKRGVQVIGMSGDTYTSSHVRPTLASLHITYENMDDPHTCLRIEDAYNAEPLPSIYVIDRKGIVRWSENGDLDIKTLRKVLDSILKSQ